MEATTTLEHTEPAALFKHVGPAISREQIIAGAIYLTDEAALLVRVQPSTIRNAIRTGKIRGKGRPYRILGSELFKLV